MNWIFYILGAVTVGAAVLAIFEQRKKKRLISDRMSGTAHMPERAAHARAEAIRTEDHFRDFRDGGGPA